MRPCDLSDARVGLLGFGREGRSTQQALLRAGHRGTFVVFEDAPRAADAGSMRWLSGDAAVRALAKIDVLVASPGIPPRHPVHVAARERGTRVTTATNLFLAECEHEDVPVIAVSGSKGKSTTATLLHRALGFGGRETALVGNVGAPALDQLDDILARRALVVFEMSSYQASALERSVETVVLTELFPEHLDWHGSLQAYYRDKLRVAALQEPEALTLFNGANEELAARAPFGPARHEAFNVPEGVHFAEGAFRAGADVLFGDARMLLRGAHNRRNACGVIAACRAWGVETAAVEKALATFGGLPHRLEVVGVHGGLTWVNDSISTAPEAAVAALESFSGGDVTLLAGGHDRGFDFAPLAHAVLRHGITRVGVLPPSGLKLAEALRAHGFRGELREAGDLASLVTWAARVTPRRGTVVFSPASPSYGMFRNFEERGETFRALVAGLGAR